jgi:hypothetical protein
MPGLVPGIHAETPPHSLKAFDSGAAWMAGTSPAMTIQTLTVPYSGE